MTPDLRDKLKEALVRNGFRMAAVKSDNKAEMSSYSLVIKKLVKIEGAILKALDANNENPLIDEFGEFYLHEIGVKQ